MQMGPASQEAARPRSNLTAEQASRERAHCSPLPSGATISSAARLRDLLVRRRRPRPCALPKIEGPREPQGPPHWHREMQQQTAPEKPTTGTASGTIVSEGPPDEKYIWDGRSSRRNSRIRP
ncbi:hypothetical protein NDU88_003028 [Pleurodeles waltl]|uniref:Uncharacterized protein n=1 Tax=Pleurodeles waltl TaxID=8319 RepID=A0AAV7WMX7_PLEWA|nr:hypothetical protein NDU88_003028 [Pleurodeles waltl]